MMLLPYPQFVRLAMGLAICAALGFAQGRAGGAIGLKDGGFKGGGFKDGSLKDGRRMGPGMRPGLKKGPPPPARAMIERWREMSPDERQQMVDRLPPERREAFRRRMEMWDSLNPQERKGAGDRLDRFRDLPPAQQRAARQAFRQFNQLPPERRREMRQEMTVLRGMSDEERTARLNSDDFRSKFDARERGLLQDLAASLPE
ncbi:MAG: DUF3106 domain-containing protein [Bryobacteraceae bacterium]|nr:DUF3106 domain-containing protein [Bryobacteraceae bacterium]